MPRLADWMEIADVQFLARFADAEEALPVAVIAEQTHYPVEYAERRCRLLAEEGLVQPVGAGVYELRELGAAFLDGDIDADRLRRGG
ncbi:MAG: MarR family transcriptional regulator [Halobacteriaceae archaeon]